LFFIRLERNLWPESWLTGLHFVTISDTDIPSATGQALLVEEQAMRYIFAFAVSLGLATAANAVTVVSVAGPDVIPTGPRIDFEGNVASLAAAGVDITGNFRLATGTGPGQAAPLGNATQYLSVPNLDLDPPPGGNLTTVDFRGFIHPSAVTSLSIYWGSIDTYNTITLLDAALVPFASFTGTDIFTLAGIGSPPFGSPTNPVANRRVTFTLGAGETLGGVLLNSTQFAFETDDWVFGVVPEPATWAMLIAGFGMVGFAMRRRKGLAVTTA
jgi:hypothetical protein